MSALPQRLSELLEDLKLVEDRNDRLLTLVDFADRFVEVPERLATRPFSEANHVQRCESEAYVFVEDSDQGGVRFHFAVENPQGISAKAMAVILHETLSGEDPETIHSVPADIVYQIFGKELSMGKGQGLMGMIELTKALARRHQIQRLTQRSGETDSVGATE